MENLRVVTTRVPPKRWKKMKIYCVKNEVSFQTFVAEAIGEKLLRADCKAFREDKKMIAIYKKAIRKGIDPVKMLEACVEKDKKGEEK